MLRVFCVWLLAIGIVESWNGIAGYFVESARIQRDIRQMQTEIDRGLGWR